MKEQVFKVTNIEYPNIWDMKSGKSYILKDSGVSVENGCAWVSFLKERGSTLYEKWCNYWETQITFKEIEFALIATQNIDKKASSFNLLSNNFEVNVYNDECYLKPYLADSMEFSLAYNDIDELIEILQIAKESKKEME